jgi:hypothetical protein
VSKLFKCQYGVPQIFENEAHGIVREIFNDIKFVLKVPIVNFIFRTLALYPDFLALAWKQVRPNMLTVNVEETAQMLRYPDISLNPPAIDWQQYYTTQAIEKISHIVFTFNYVNTKLLLIASAWAESLGGRPIMGDLEVQGFINPGIIPTLPLIKLIRIYNAPQFELKIFSWGVFGIVRDFNIILTYTGNKVAKMIKL